MKKSDEYINKIIIIITSFYVITMIHEDLEASMQIGMILLFFKETDDLKSLGFIKQRLGKISLA